MGVVVMRFKYINFSRKKLPLIITVVASLAVVAVCTYFIIQYKPLTQQESPPALSEELPQDKLTVTAEKEGSAGIDLDSGFIIISPEPIYADEFSANLSLQPETAFTVVQRTATELYMQPAQVLQPGMVYNVLLSENSYEPPMSWAFQTKATFRLQKTFPAANSYWAPVNSGIEFTFTQPVDDIGAYVSFSPALPGRFENFDDVTVVYIPSEDMEYDIDYTVTLAANLPSFAGDTLGEEISFSFHTDTGNDANHYDFYTYDGLEETFTSFDPVYIKLYASEEISDQDIQVDVYRYPSLDDYLAAEESGRQQGILSVEGLRNVSEFSGRLIINDEDYWRLAYLPLPENPGPGWYLVDMQVVREDIEQELRAQKLLQITDIAVYTQTANNQLLLWLNDAASGQSLNGAQVTVGEQTALSDAEGVALLDILPPPRSEQNDDYYQWNYSSNEKIVRIKQGEKQYGAYMDVYGRQDQLLEEIYYTYVYTDRAAYQPDDTVNFWGLVLPRVSSSVRPEHIKLEWTAGGLYPEGLDIEVKADGTFMGQIKLEKRASGWESLEFTMDGKHLAYMSFTVMEYVKPVYTAALTLDKEYYRKGETINALAELSFFEGTPASGIEMNFYYSRYYGDYGDENFREYSDANGRCQAQFSVQPNDSWQPVNNYVSVSSQGAEDQNVYSRQSVLVFPSDYMVENNFTVKQEGYSFAVDGYSINYAAVESGEFNKNWNTKLLRGQPAELTGQASLYQVEYVREKTGEFYDFINKVTIDRYSYNTRESLVMTIPVQTENGRFVSDTLPYPTGENAYYYIKLSVTAPDGQQLRQTCYTPGQRYYYYDRNRDIYESYSFRQEIDTELMDEGGYYRDYYDGNYYYSSYSGAYRSINERINFSLLNNKEEMPAAGRMLYTVVGQKTYSINVSFNMRFSLDFLPQYCPNVLVIGAYFDGRHIYTVDSTYLNYRFQDSELTIETIPEKERYSPGDQVTLQLRITDKAGRGQSAHYLLSVADEAAFAVMEQNISPLSDIYETFYIYCYQYASYNQPFGESGGAECGEGGGENTRRDFVDTVAFISGQTDDNGLASVSFKLADNLTSWRLTSIAFCEQSIEGAEMPLVGKNISNITCGLPFFINQVLNGRYLAGDSIGLSLRAAGSAISGSDLVSYDVQLSGPDIDISQTAVSRAGDFLPLVFDPLPQGAYTILIKASCGSYSDALELPLTVTESLLTTHRQQNGDLSAGLNIQARRFPVRLTLYDMDNKLFYDTLYTLLAAYGQRADQILTRTLAGVRLNELNHSEDFSQELEITAEELNDWRYGLRIFPYATTDTLLTAKAAAVAGQYLDGPALAEYFREILANEESYAEDICAAYMGLAALKEPVLLELRKFFAIAQADDALTLSDTLHLAIGLALLGDHGAAGAWYEKNIHGALKSQGNTLYFSSENDAHYDYMISAEAAMLSILLNHADHRGLLAYLTGQRSVTYAPLLELATYINKYSPKPESAAACRYMLGGQTVNVSFADQRQVYLELGEEQLNMANFAVEQGAVGYSAYYFGGLEEAQTALPTGVNIRYSLSADTLKMGETLKVTTTVTFDSSAPVGCYHIAQVVPSGLRFDSVSSSYANNWYYRVGEMGLVDFYIYPISKWDNDDAFGRDTMPSSVAFNYQARAVLPGTYIMEADAISYSGDNTLYAGERRQITIVE